MKITSPLTEILIKEVLICAKNNSVSNHVQLGGSQHSLHHQKITPAFTSYPLNSHLNTIKTVTTPFHPSLYIQPNTLLISNTRVRLHTSFSIVHFHKTKALNPGDNQSILETDIDFFPPRTRSDVLSLLLHTYPHAHTTTVHAHGMETYICPYRCKNSTHHSELFDIPLQCSEHLTEGLASSYVFCTIALIQKELPFTRDFGC
jgi:hypothetical protein